MKTKQNNQAQELISKGRARLTGRDFNNRLYMHDYSLWKTEEEAVKIINNSLGWSEVYLWTLARLKQITSFVEEVKGLYEHVVLMGMGGSSLAPEVLRSVFGAKEGYPKLLVLDSTNPDWVAGVRAQINPAKTLFIFASKSGGTVEPSSQFAYFYEEVSKALGAKNAGQNFIAVTDPSTGLETLAKEKNFRKIFLNKADIGGRFSALSFFGMVPAALCGVDVEKLLKVTQEIGSAFKSGADTAALSLGALMGQAYEDGKDKLTLILPKEIAVFGLWVEQLVAESTGKEGCGVVPVTGEALPADYDYGQDRFFVSIALKNTKGTSVKSVARRLYKSAHPFMEIEMRDIYEIGAQFLLWEIATAACGMLMKINPFDQPNVQAAKTAAKNILADLASGKKEKDAPILVSPNLEGKVKLETLGDDIAKITSGKDYIALLAYVNQTPQTNQIFDNMRASLAKKTKSAVTFGYGPRYLHSTGQLHKGDGGGGIFVIFSADAGKDVKIPAAPYTFADLVKAQALADFKVLEEKGRRAVIIHLGVPVEETLKKIGGAF